MAEAVNTFAVAGLPEIALNGPDEVGLAAGAEAALAVANHLRVSPRAVADNLAIARAMAHFDWSGNLSAEHRVVLDIGLSIIVTTRIHGVDDNDFTTKDADVVLAPAFNTGPHHETVVARLDAVVAAAADRNAVLRAALVVYSTKVTWFQMNHHVGQGAIQGFAKKVAHMVFGDDVNSLGEIASAMHTLGHWVSTKLVLGVWFNDDRTMGGFSRRVREQVALPTRDIKLRILALPAGCAKMSFCLEALRRMRDTPFEVCLTCQLALDPFRRAVISAMTDPIAAHVGGSYLCGVSVDTTNTVHEDLLAQCSLFVRLVGPKSTLAQSRAALSMDDARSSCPGVYSNMSQVLRVMADDETIKQRIAPAIERMNRLGEAGALAMFSRESIEEELEGLATENGTVTGEAMDPVMRAAAEPQNAANPAEGAEGRVRVEGNA